MFPVISRLIQTSPANFTGMALDLVIQQMVLFWGNVGVSSIYILALDLSHCFSESGEIYFIPQEIPSQISDNWKDTFCIDIVILSK